LHFIISSQLPGLSLEEAELEQPQMQVFKHQLAIFSVPLLLHQPRLLHPFIIISISQRSAAVKLDLASSQTHFTYAIRYD